MSQILDFHITKPLKRGTKNPYNHKFLSVHMYLVVNFGLMRNMCLFTVWDVKGAINQVIYCVVFNIDNFRTYLFIGNINNLEEVSKYFGNSDPHGFTREETHTMTGPVKYCLADILTNPLVPNKCYCLMNYFLFNSMSDLIGVSWG